MGNRQDLATTDAVNARNVNGKIEHEHDLTREPRAVPKADAGSQIDSQRDAKVCLALLPYGRKFEPSAQADRIGGGEVEVPDRCG